MTEEEYHSGWGPCESPGPVCRHRDGNLKLKGSEWHGPGGPSHRSSPHSAGQRTNVRILPAAKHVHPDYGLELRAPRTHGTPLLDLS